MQRSVNTAELIMTYTINYRPVNVKNIETLIADGGDITVGAHYPIECVATASDAHNTVAILVRRDGETLNALLKRLDNAIGMFYDHDEVVDEVNAK